MTGVAIDALLDWNFLGGYIGGQAITMIVGGLVGLWIFKNSVAEAAMNGMNTVYGNTGFLGIPLMLAAFGEAATEPTMVTVVVNSAVVVGAATLFIELGSNQATGPRQLLRVNGMASIKIPMLVAPVAGIAWALIGQPLPLAVDRFCELRERPPAPAPPLQSACFWLASRSQAAPAKCPAPFSSS